MKRHLTTRRSMRCLFLRAHQEAEESAVVGTVPICSEK